MYFYILGVVLEVLEWGRQESLPTILCEPESFGGHSEPLKYSTALHKYHSNEHPLFAPVLRCRQSTMPRHRLFPPPCPDTNIEHSLLQYLCKAVLVITRECPRASLGLLSPLRCSARLRSYPHTPDLSHKIVGRDSWLFFKNF